MQQLAIFYPMLGMFLVTMVIGIMMARLRFAAVSRKDLNPRYYSLNRGHETPEYLAKVSNNFDNLMALPTLFYVVCISLYVTNLVNELQLVLAWLYVLVRAVHSYIHVTYNKVLHRMRVFMLSLVLLTAMWFTFAFALVT